jgi:hypothetical protein
MSVEEPRDKKRKCESTAVTYSASLSPNTPAEQAELSMSERITMLSTDEVYNRLMNSSVVQLSTLCPLLPASVLLAAATAADCRSAYDEAVDVYGADDPYTVLLLFAQGQETDVRVAVAGLPPRCRILICSLPAVQAAYPFLFEDLETPCYANIITPNLFLGPASSASDARMLDRLRITHVLSVLDRPMLPPHG